MDCNGTLESFFKEKFLEEKRFTHLGNWWDRHGENEIDLVCEDAISHRLEFCEIKREKGKISLHRLQEKAKAFLTKNPQFQKYQLSFKTLSLRDL